ncbi:MAG: aromatic ring-hydroxylating dioxygenase subunit alpha [Proteobacteria bacterium]|nr:aromatic ring-hydroxylating dioxygenase subunit alpha [Pseudomonadota bacterium]
MSDNASIADLIASQKPGWALDQRFYTDPEIYQLELDRIVTRNWILAGHASQIPDAGDYLVFSLTNESAIIVRGKDGKIRAFANICRHRGSLVCLENRGNKRKFECPYHGWTYDLDGKLIGARSMREDFNKEAYGLHPVSLSLLSGLIFVCFCDDPPSIEGAQRDLAEPMAMFDFENLKVAASKTYPIAANWKLAIENYQECYHCATAHPEYAKMHTLMLDPQKRDRIQGPMRQRMAACGLKDIEHDFIDTYAKSGEQGYGYSRTALFEGYKTGSRDGEPLAPLLGELKEYDGGASDFTLGPFTFFLAYSDHVVGYVFSPVDHKNCQCKIHWFVRKDAVEGKDYDRNELMWLWDVTTHADEKIIVNNWKGVHSQYYRPGPFSGMERMERRYIEWMLLELSNKN